MSMQNQMLNNIYNNQMNNGFVFPQQNPLMNMNMNYLDPRFQQMMQMNQGFQRNNALPGDMNNFDFYNNMNNLEQKMKHIYITSCKKYFYNFNLFKSTII